MSRPHRSTPQCVSGSSYSRSEERSGGSWALLSFTDITHAPVIHTDNNTDGSHSGVAHGTVLQGIVGSEKQCVFPKTTLQLQPLHYSAKFPEGASVDAWWQMKPERKDWGWSKATTTTAWFFKPHIPCSSVESPPEEKKKKKTTTLPPCSCSNNTCSPSSQQGRRLNVKQHKVWHLVKLKVLALRWISTHRDREPDAGSV